MTEKPREIAVRILQQHAQQDGFIDALLEKEAGSTRLSGLDRGLLQELVYGTLRWEQTLDYLIRRKTRARAPKGELQILLRLALYQIFWLERIPDHAAVHEAVELAKKLGFKTQSGFVNALLRDYVRERAQTVTELEELKRSQPALAYSQPEWMFARWRDSWGEENARRLLAWNNRPPPTYARLNTLKGSTEELLKLWKEEGVESEPRKCDWVPDNIVFELKEHPSLATLPSFQQGWFYIQDPSTLLAPNLLAAGQGETILDLCAAPGGKTTYLAQLMQNQGSITAEEPDAPRRELLNQNCARLGASNVRVTHSNSTDTAAFDRILVDAPCSNTGVMRRRIEVRWRFQESELVRLCKLQLELLNRAAARLKSNGVIIYSTCSLEPDENQNVVQEFLKVNPGFRLETERTLLPFVDEVDGAYAAKLVR